MCTSASCGILGSIPMMNKSILMCNRQRPYMHFSIDKTQKHITQLSVWVLAVMIGLWSVTVRSYLRETEGALTSSPSGPRDLQSTAQGPLDTLADDGSSTEQWRKVLTSPMASCKSQNKEYYTRNVLQFLWCFLNAPWNQICLLGSHLTLSLKTQSTWPFSKSHRGS